ncbi:MAG: hypothetical protein LBR60_03455 [Fibrobacter sp.]|jgi:hypothetical protein|nr:hypothetical protein [Fibrobacter sp.]
MARIYEIFGIILVSLMVSACRESSEASIIVGREWNAGVKVVADTTSLLSLDDPVFFELRYGKTFDIPALEWSVREVSSGKEIVKRTAAVTSRDAVYTVFLKNSRGENLKAAQFFKTKTGGDFVIEFKAPGGNLIASKQVQVKR